ncbi:MAG: hypothetical protein ACOC80_08820 [Petrotogales bacterium]
MGIIIVAAGCVITDIPLSVKLVSPANESVYNHYPRSMHLEWEAKGIMGSVKYYLEIQYCWFTPLILMINIILEIGKKEITQALFWKKPIATTTSILLVLSQADGELEQKMITVSVNGQSGVISSLLYSLMIINNHFI